MKLSAFRCGITPPLGHPLCAGWYPPAVTVDDPLFANGVVLVPARELPIVLCALDWAELSNGEHDLWRAALARAAETTPDRVAVHCLHAHDAPWPDRDAQGLLDATGSPGVIMQRAWCDDVLRSVAVSLEQSLSRAVEVSEIRTGIAWVQGVASNRRILGRDGKIRGVRWTRCDDEELRAEPEGVIDPGLKSISFWGEGRKLAAMHYYAVHPTSYDGTGRVTPDFAGLARERIQDEEGVPHLYFTECAGNITCGKYNDGRDDNRELFTRKIAEAMRCAEQNAENHPAVEPVWTTEEILLPPREDLTREAMESILNDPEISSGGKSRAAIALAYRKRCEAGKRITLSALFFGDAVVVLHLPGEAFIEYQLLAKSLRPEALVAVPAYGDCGPGYIPLSRSFAEGGYEPTDAFCSSESEAVLRNAIRRLLEGAGQKTSATNP